MKNILIVVFVSLLLGACSDKPAENTNQSNNSRSEAGAASTPQQLKAGDTVIYYSGSGQRFYETKVLSIDGTRAKLQDDDKTIERELAELYTFPKTGDKTTAQAGDIVAARFGQTKVWPGAEVVKVGDKVTIKWLSTGNTDEVAHESILMLSPAVAAKVKASFSTK